MMNMYTGGMLGRPMMQQDKKKKTTKYVGVIGDPAQIKKDKATNLKKLEANKAKKDSRIDSKGFSGNSVESNIKSCCEQLGLLTYGNEFNQSERLLNNLNKRDREIIAEELDLNEDADTIS